MKKDKALRNTIREIYDIKCMSDENTGEIKIEILGSSFLKTMVRIMIGSALAVYFKEKDDLNRELELLKAESELLNSKLKTLKEKQARIEARQNEIAGEQVELRNIIKVAEEKIVRSKLAL